ncbi:hypothetical protein [Arthrobacter sp. AZCC_0090]|uniref:hypothetical protein n=1 Tax=Arthrobacter sp. AZCC_0090 TaxID=2735881 RepID=UPI00160B9589|nr:hypothetical protein [Arthrobacter sp. AZCC_0090]MBB6407054.1 hypothetical protein [Arthrobacter sp. AZCC_0090]
MNQFTRMRTGGVVSLRPGSSQVPGAVVCTAVIASSVAHLVAAAMGPGGAMAWWMAAMGVACLTCAVPMFGRRRISIKHRANRAAGHLWAMTAVMTLIHLSLLLFAGTGSHHGGGSSITPAGQGIPAAGHGAAMLGLIAVELLCLLGASMALRLTRVAAVPASALLPLSPKPQSAKPQSAKPQPQEP